MPQPPDTSLEPGFGDDGPAAEWLAPAVRENGQKRLIRVALANCVIAACALGNVAAVYILYLGGTAQHVGILAAAAHVAILAQLFGMKAIRRAGKARLVALGRAMGSVSLLGLVALAAAGGKGTTAIWLALAAYGGFRLLKQFGHTGWWPLLQDNTTGDRVGAFFARMRTRLRFVQILAPLAVGWFIGSHPRDGHFITLFAIAALVLIASIGWVRGVPERPMSEPTGSLLRQMRAALAVRSVRRLVTFMCANAFVQSLGLPFWVVVLKAGGLPPSQLVWLGAVVSFADVVGLRRWGRLVDESSARPALDIALWGQVALGPLWLVLFWTGAPLLVVAVCLHLAWGVLRSGGMMGRTRAMMDAVPAHCQTEAFPLMQCAQGLAGALAALGAGAIMKGLMAATAGTGSLHAPVLYLAIVQVANVFVWLLSRRLHRHTEQQEGPAGAQEGGKAA